MLGPGGVPIGGASAPAGPIFMPGVNHPIELNIQVAGTDGVFSSGSGYDGSVSSLPSAAFLIFLLIICLILVL
jgi:hypothetical protein